LALADSVIATLPLKKGHIKDKGQIDCFKLVQDIKSKGDKDAHVAKDLLELRNLIDNEVNSNCLLLILSNGTCLGLWESDFVNEITKN